MSATTFAPTAADRAGYALAETPPVGGNSLRIHDRTGVSLAAGSPDLIVGLAVLKAGTFHGMFGPTEVTTDDLELYVSRFAELRGVIRPALRIDHSMDVLSVIGRFVDLRIENRADETIGGTIVPMLVGDVQLVGTPAENQQIKAWIGSGKLDERSSELWPYRTNTGAEYASIFAGCAFVDIPAVEGLSPITLRRGGATLAATNTEGTPMSATTETEAPAEETLATEPVETDAETPAEEPAETPAEEPSEDPAEGEEPPAEEEPTGTLGASRSVDIEAEVERRVALRLEAENRLTNLRGRGILVPAVANHADTLLRHADQTVRDAAFAVLDAQVSPVKLGASTGVLGAASSGAPAGGRTTEVIHLDMTREQVTEAYTALSAGDRAKYRPELDAWQREHPTGE